MQITDTIHFVEGRDLDSNMYLIIDSNNDLTLVDTGHDGERRYLIEYIEKIGLDPANIKNVVLTHVHIDHCGGLGWLVKKYAPAVNVCEIEAYAIEEGDLELTLAGMMRGYLDPVHVDCQLKDEGIFAFGDHEFEIHVTPGHTKGSICLLDRQNKILISGDTVFADGSFGRVDFPTGSAEQMQSSLDYLATLDVEVLLPGHMNVVLHEGTKHIKASARMAQMMI